MKYYIKPIRLLLFTNILAIVQSVYLYSKLPNKVAIRFNSAGIAESFGDKFFVSLVEILIIIFLTLIFLLLSKFLRKMPYALINIPYKSYWLTEKNRENCFNIISGQLLKIIAITNLLLMALYQVIANASINGSYKLTGNSWWLIIVYLIIVSFTIVKMHKYFNNPDLN